MPIQYNKEQFWKLYKNLPQELKDTLWAQETGDVIYETCQKYEVADHLEDIVNLTGQVLIGLILPKDFQNKLEGVGIAKDVAEKVAHEINRFIFYPVKPALEQLHNMEVGTMGAAPPSSQGEQPKVQIEQGEERTEVVPEKEDAYRESIE